jgi:hypothetical protein
VITRIGALILLLIAGAVTPMVAVLAPAAAADLSGLVDVEIRSLLPASPRPGDTLQVSGVLRNASQVPLRDVGVRMVVGTQPLTSTADAFTYATEQPPIDGVLAAQKPGFVSLSPGQESTFTLAVPFDDVQLNGPGVYPIGVESVDGRADILGRSSVLVPWFPPGSLENPARIAFLWPIVGLPARDAEDVFLSSAVAAEIDRGGRLRELVTVGARFPDSVSWVIDPQAVQSAALLARPHRQLDESAAAVELPGDPAAAAWLQQLNRAVDSPAGADVTAAAYADPDSPAEVSAGQLSDLVLATTTAPELLETQLGREVSGGFSWPPDGRLDQATLNALRVAGVRAVALASEGVSRSDYPLVTLSTDSGPITGIVGDAELALALRLIAERPESPLQWRQLFFSLVGLKASDQEGRTLIALPPTTRWQAPERQLDMLLTGLASAEYAELVQLGEVLGAPDPPVVEAELLPFGPLAQAARLSGSHMAAVAAAGATLGEIGDIAPAPGDALSPFRESLLRSSSSAWRDESLLGAVQLERTAEQITAQRDKVTISSAGPVAFPGEQGRVPVTVSNDLTVAINVGLTLSATPSYRIEPEPVPPITVPPGQRLSLEVPVRVVGSEPLTVTAQLLTPEGLPYGPGEDFELRTSAYSRVAAWAVGLAFGALILMAGWSTLRRFRRRSPRTATADTAAAESDSEPMEATRVEGE